MRVKEESEIAGTASDPNTSWQTEVEKVETVTDFLFLGSKITVEDDCSHESKRRLLLGREAMTMTDLREHIIKQRHHFTEGEMVGWHFNGREFELTPGDGERQRGLVCCRPWGHKESDRTERLIYSDLNMKMGVQVPDVEGPCHAGNNFSLNLGPSMVMSVSHL